MAASSCSFSMSALEMYTLLHQITLSQVHPGLQLTSFSWGTHIHFLQNSHSKNISSSKDIAIKKPQVFIKTSFGFSFWQNKTGNQQSLPTLIASTYFHVSVIGAFEAVELTQINSTSCPFLLHHFLCSNSLCQPLLAQKDKSTTKAKSLSSSVFLSLFLN